LGNNKTEILHTWQQHVKQQNIHKRKHNNNQTHEETEKGKQNPTLLKNGNAE